MMAQIEYEFSEISIHSFFAEADNVRDLVLKSPDISIHSFFAEADFMSGTYSSSSLIFQSTASSQKLTMLHFLLLRYRKISIHRFFAEADSYDGYWYVQFKQFQSTASSQKLTANISNLSISHQSHCIHIVQFHLIILQLLAFPLIFFYSKSLKKGANPPEFSCSLGIRTYMMKDNS